MEQQIRTSSKFNFDKVFEYCLWAIVLITPIVFVPSALVSLFSAKIAFLATAAVVFIAVFFASVLSKGIIQIPKAKFLIPIALFPIIALISSFFSGVAIKSIAGEVFELGTFGSLLILSLLMFITLFAMGDKVKTGITTIYAFLISAGVVILHLFLRIFSDLIPAVIATKIPNFIIGGPTDTAVFLGAAIIASVIALNMLTMNKKIRIALYALIVVSMLFVGSIKFTPVIVVLGLFSLFYFIYTFSWSTNPSLFGNHRNEKASFLSLVIIIVVVVLMLSGNTISGYLSGILKTNLMVEIRPNFTTTMDLVGEAWKKNAALGVGPNMFKELWDMYKPADINTTQFWASSFNAGSGFIPTIAATSGVLGLLSILSFLVLYVISGFKSIFSLNENSDWKFLSLISFLISLFLWIIAFVYVPNISVLSIAFIFTGIFAATLIPQGVAGVAKINVFSSPRSNFAAVFGIVVVLISSVAGGYFVWERVIAASIYQKGVNILSSGNFQEAEKIISKSISLTPNDLYWKSFSEASLNQAGTLLNSISSPQNISDSQRTVVQTEISNAIESAKQAIVWNPKNYSNWFALGRVYETLAMSGIKGASENAVNTFKEAQVRSPSNPATLLAFARLSALSGDLNGARSYINEATKLKSNYTDAYFMLAQLEISTNNITGAIRSIESMTLMDPQNAGLYFQLGLLKYGSKDYAGAISAFERAVAIFPDYANAKYFLGLSYDTMGRRTDAINQFEGIQETNPDNAEVSLILSNLKANKSPFTNAKPPIDNKPEKRTEPPVKEN